MNSSKTWKSGERCRISGTYFCRNCRSAGRDTTREIREGAIFPMCETCPQKDVTYVPVTSAVSAPAGGSSS